jgi:hypothetical protein
MEDVMATRRFSSVVLAALAMACASDTPSGPIPGLPFARALLACGPADGPAVEILIVATESAGEPTTPYVRIYLTHGIGEIAGRRFALGDTNGAASYVPSPGETEVARRGEVRIETASASQGVTGTVDLTFPVRGRVAGRFTAPYTARAMLCG